VTVKVARFAELDTRTLYALLRLRVDVFVVEQKCAYPELDGRDVEPGTRHLWLEEDGEPAAYLRILDENRIGRVCVAPKTRGTGAAKRLMREALTYIGNAPSTLDAQAYLVDFYRSFGYEPAGPEYIDDGIPHVPMFRAGS
jgi:ElaA protein